jgi:hypothetical protein
MIQIEKAIHNTILAKGKIITRQAKATILERHEALTQKLMQHMDAQLADKTNDNFQEAETLLDQTVMRIGEEMDIAISDFRSTLHDPDKRSKYNDRLQRQVMNEIRPKIAELQDQMLRKVTTNIETAVQDAQDDLHLTQGRLTAETENTTRKHNEIITLNIAALKTDLRNAEFRNRHQNDRRSGFPEEPQTHPSTPEQEPQEMRHNQGTRGPNPYQRAPQVSPHQDVNIPSEDTWNSMVCKCKEKVTLTYALPQNVKDCNAHRMRDCAHVRTTDAVTMLMNPSAASTPHLQR